MMIRTAGLLVSLFFLCFVPSFANGQGALPEPSLQIDKYIDARFEGTPKSTTELLNGLAKKGVASMKDLERVLRGKRSKYQDPTKWLGKNSKHAISCLHVDYQSHFLMHASKELDINKPISLVVVGHGGNSSMTPRRAERTASLYLHVYARGICKNMNAVVVAPVSSRGWGHIGNSLIDSTVSKVKRMFPIDSDRIYITGQSMGGHLGYRSALNLPDRWGAVSPHSGGYDFVKKNTIGNLINVPGFAIWGKTEPYGINKDNRTNEKWAKDHGLEWKFVEKNGGHTIYQDELKNVAKFFENHPRNLYRKKVYFRQQGSMKFTEPWKVKGWPKHEVYSKTRPFRWNLRHWLEIQPRPKLGKPLTVLAENQGNNQFDIQSENVRNLKIFLHPKMVDFDKPVRIRVNGEEVFHQIVNPDPKIMFEMAREFDDRGRVFWAEIDLEIRTDQAVEIKKEESKTK